MKYSLACLMLVLSGAALAAPPPPPPPAVLATEKSFFELLPEFAPGEHTEQLKIMIAEDLVVTNEGEPMFRTRDEWLGWRQSMASERIERFQMLREKFWRDRKGRVVVEEFWLPLVKGVSPHFDRPRRIVAYSFAGGKLTRVDYIVALDRATFLGPKR